MEENNKFVFTLEGNYKVKDIKLLDQKLDEWYWSQYSKK